MPDNPRVSVQRYMGAGALGGLGSGLVVTALELAVLARLERPLDPGLAAALAGVIVPLQVLAGAVAGLAVAGLRWAGEALGGPGRRGDKRAALVAAVVSLAPAFWFLTQLGAGRKAARVLGPLPVRVAGTLAAAALVAVACWAGLRLGGWLVQTRSRGLGLGLGLGLLAATVGLFGADALLYRRLYGFIHGALAGAYLLAGTGACCCLWVALVGRARPGARLPVWLRRAGPVMLLALALGTLLWTRGAVLADQRLRFVALEQTTTTQKLLALAPLPRVVQAPDFLDARPGRGQRGETFRVADANVVLVTVDALRPDHLGAYGYGRPTSPNLDALATRSSRFQWAYCQSPLTCYSIPSLHTGDYLKSTLPLLSRPPPTLATILGARGYTTAAFYNASIFFCDDRKATGYGARKFGFAHAETHHLQAPVLTDRVLAYLKDHRRRGRSRLLLWVHYFDVHEPYHRHPPFDFGDRDVDRYDAEIALVDREIGRLVAALSILEGPTIFVLTADHGEEFREHGGTYHGSSLYEEQIRVPLVFGVPGIKPRTVRTPAQLVDVAPTVLALLGVNVPPSMRGRSLVPDLLGRPGPSPAAFAEVHTKKMVRHRDWKLIHDYRRSTYELYDLRTDPRERVNLAGRRPAMAARLRGLLHGWFERLRGLDRATPHRPRAIDLGRIGDRRAVPLLARLLNTPGALSRWRQEAARLLGQLRDRTAADALWGAAADDDALVAAEAATALGELKDRRARLVLPHVVATSRGRLRARAAIALARVDHPEATPALLEGLLGDSWELQNRAAHYLGFVGDARATDALLAMSSRSHLRSRACLALGRLGRRHPDPRILPFLLGMVRGDRHQDVRQRALAGIGYLGDRSAVAPLQGLLPLRAGLSWLPETLTRLGALGDRGSPGLDLSDKRKGQGKGWGACRRNRSGAAPSYLGQTWCAVDSPAAALALDLARRPGDAVLELRVRPLVHWLERRTLQVSINGKALKPAALARGWQVLRLATTAGAWRRGRNRVRLRLDLPGGAHVAGTRAELLAVDYVMLAPAMDQK